MYRTQTAKSDLKKAAELISTSILWNATPQGPMYWDNIYNLLMALSMAAPPDQITPKEEDQKKNIAVSQNRVLIFHIFEADAALCGLKGDPATWPSGHQFVRLHNKDKATCQFCKAKAPL